MKTTEITKTDLLRVRAKLNSQPIPNIGRVMRCTKRFYKALAAEAKNHTNQKDDYAN